MSQLCRSGRIVANGLTALIIAATYFWCLPAKVTAAESGSDVIKIILDAGDVTGNPGQKNVVIPIYLDNFADTVAGVEIWLQLDRDDIMRFQTDSVTIIDTSYWKCKPGTGTVHPGCTDSIQVYDTTQGYQWRVIKPVIVAQGSHSLAGTKMNGWEFVTTRSLGGIGADLKITGLANQSAPPYTHGIGPQVGGTLINVLGDILPIPDTATERTVNINIVIVPLDNFSLSNQIGTSIGIVTDSILDTVYWHCTQFVSGHCVNYEQVPTPPYDSLSTRWITVGTLDLSQVIIVPGSVTVNAGPPCLCGDADGSSDLNIGDVVYLIARIFSGGAAPVCGGVPNNLPGDADANCGVDIGDAVFMITHIFMGGPAPAGCCATGP